MTDRSEIDRRVRALYAARAAADLDGVCALFADDATLRFSGPSHSSPIAVKSSGLAQFRPLLALMIKSFKLIDHAILSVIIEDEAEAVHWRATIHSRISGTRTPTELVDLIRMKEGLIASYIEFFAPFKD